MPHSTSALGSQVGGDHYLKRGLQPVEFWAANKWDGFAASILKYVTRWRDKSGVTDLEKALHFGQLRMELGGGGARPAYNPRRIAMRVYVRENGINELEEPILTALELWVDLGFEGNGECAEYRHFVKLLSDYIAHQKGLING